MKNIVNIHRQAQQVAVVDRQDRPVAHATAFSTLISYFDDF